MSETKVFTATVDASAIASWSSGTETGLSNWNGKYRATPVGVSASGAYSFRGLVNVPIDFTTLTNAVQITGATLTLRYFTQSGWNQTNNTGTRTLNVHRLLTGFTTGVGTDSTTGWASSATQNWNSRVKTAGTHYDATVIGSIAFSGTQTNLASKTINVLPFIQKVAPASLLVGSTTGVAGSALTNYGLLLKSNAVSNTSDGMAVYSIEGGYAPTITLTYTINQKPDKPVPTAPASVDVEAPDIQTGEHVNFSVDFTDPDAGDLPSKWDLEISKNSDWSEPFYSAQYTTTTDPLTAAVPMSNFTSNINYYWRVRAYDTAGFVSDWSDATNAVFRAPTNTSGFPPPEGNPNFAVTKTLARNKYRLEFYPLLESLKGFNPKPSAIIFDAKKIGVATEVNKAGDFFFTLKSDHPQIAALQPMRTFWRACRWDEDSGFFRVMSEGLLTNTTSYPNEVTFYGINKLAMLDRTIVTTQDITEIYSHVDVTLADLHDLILGRNITPATITGVSFHATATITGISFPSAGKVRFTANNTFAVDDLVTITGVNPAVYNLADVSVTARTPTTFDIASTSTTAWVSGGLATPALMGNVRFAATNDFFEGQVISITGVNPSAYNLSLQTIVARSASWFEIKSALTSAWVSGGTATPAKTVLDMGWGESPAYKFRDYSELNVGNASATEKKSVQVAGQGAATALSAMADILMAGTTNKVIVENPNIGEAAAAIDTMSVGLRHRHITSAQETMPTWWINYGTNLKRYKIDDNLNLMATRASIINDSLANSTATRTAYNGTTDPDLYALYGLVDKIERTNDERNDIDFTAQLQYNLHPDRLFTLELDIVPDSIVPFKGYRVGDNIILHIVDDQVNITQELTLVAQQWIGNANGAEYLAFAFAQKLLKDFKKTAETSDTSSSSSPTQTTPSSATIGDAPYSFQRESR